MSSITPLLDTLVHQVAKQRSRVELLPRHTLPITPVPAAASTATVTEFSQSGQQLARLLAQIQTFQQQLPNQAIASQHRITSEGTLFQQSSILNSAQIIGKLQSLVTNSGLFYESLLGRWAAQKLPLAQIQRQPQNLNPTPPRIQAILGQQLELLNTGSMYIDVDLWPQASLQWLVQPNENPLVQRWREEQRQGEGDAEDNGWTSELKLTTPGFGELRAKIRIQDGKYSLHLQCAERFVEVLKQASKLLSDRITEGTGLIQKSLIIDSIK